MPDPLVATSISLQCPAKINLHLRVGPRRDDGFHPLLSWMCIVGLFDTLSLNVPARGPAAPLVPLSGDTTGLAVDGINAWPGASGIHLSLTCDPPGLPCDHRNLVVRVASAWKAGQGAKIAAHLSKRIPVGAGLGGGSSDAARMILALQQHWPAAHATDLMALGASLGSDVPFFLAGPSSVCEGRGEIVRPIDRPMPRWAILVLPPIHMATPDVYRRFDAMGLGRTQDLDCQPDWDNWTRLDATGLLQHLVNDLESPAFALRPDLAELRAGIEREIGRTVRMSGSGSSLFTLYDEPAPAREAAQRIRTIVDEKTRVEAVQLAPQLADDLTLHV